MPFYWVKSLNLRDAHWQWQASSWVSRFTENMGTSLQFCVSQDFAGARRLCPK